MKDGRDRIPDSEREAAPGFEPGYRGFADLCLTAWLCRPILTVLSVRQACYIIARVAPECKDFWTHMIPGDCDFVDESGALLGLLLESPFFGRKVAEQGTLPELISTLVPSSVQR